MFHWLDLVIIAILLISVILEVKRGFGRALFDLIALVVTMRIAFAYNDSLAAGIRLAADPAVNTAVVYAASFVVVGAVLLFLAHLLYSNLLWSADYFDPALGGVCGVFAGVILSHALANILALPAGHGEIPYIIRESALGWELLTFESCHNVLEKLQNFGHTEYPGLFTNARHS